MLYLSFMAVVVVVVFLAIHRKSWNTNLGNTTGMEFIETTLTLVMHNATFNAELSKNTDPAADVNEELSKATNPAPDAFLKILITEFNREQISPTAAVTQNAFAVKLKCYALLLFALNSGLDDGKLDMEILHEPVTLLRSFIAKSVSTQNN